MFLETINLTNYRNYEKLEVNFDKKSNVLLGKNAQGKTNVLEAIYYLSLLKSHRAIYNKDLIYFDKEFARMIAGVKLISDRKLNLDMILTHNERNMKINGYKVTKVSDFVGKINVVMFNPDDLNLIKGSPKDRRRFVDIELSKLFPNYMYHLIVFNRLLRERNKYLKVLNEKNCFEGDDYLEVLTDQMIESQLYVYEKRCDFVDKISDFTNKFYCKISDDNKVINISYKSFIERKSFDDVKKRYQKSVYQDIRKSNTNYGINRDDIEIAIDGKDSLLFASQGQQRSIVLAMKISLIHYIYQIIDDYPILLLDDVLSELDDERKTKLLDLINDQMQTFITTTSIKGIDHRIINNAKIFNVTNGSINTKE